MRNGSLVSFTLQYSTDNCVLLVVYVRHLLVKELLYFLLFTCWTCTITLLIPKVHNISNMASYKMNIIAIHCVRITMVWSDSHI